MSKRTVADDLWEMLTQAGVSRCYGIVGDALNPTVEALSRHPEIEFIHVRHEEWGAFAASADARLSEGPVAVCGTAGPGVTHLLNGLLDAKHERASVIAIAGDVETGIIDTAAIEEISPYDLFQTASLYTGRAINPVQARAVFTEAITVALDQEGPTVIALPGDVAGARSPLDSAPVYTRPHPSSLSANPADIAAVAKTVNAAEKVMIFGGDGCRDAATDVVALADRLQAPVGFSLKGKNWLESGNPNAVGMTGLLGYGGCHHAIKNADLILMLGTDFPFPGFLEAAKGKIIQVDTHASHLGRRAAIERGVRAEVGSFVKQLSEQVADKTDGSFLREALTISGKWEKRLQAYVHGGDKRSPIRPEYLAATLDRLMDDDAILTVDTGTPVMWTAHQMRFPGERRHIGSYSWASMANASPYAFGATKALPDRQVVALCGDGGFSMLGFGDLITEIQHKSPIVHVILNNSLLDFVNIEQQEAGMVPWGTNLPNPDFAAIARAFGAVGIRCENPETLEDQLREALTHREGPVVVDVVVDKFALSLPSALPKDTVKGFTLSVLKQATQGELRTIVHEGLDNLKLI